MFNFNTFLGVSGGSIINILASQLSENLNVEWKKWRIFFCDERLTSFSNSDSTFGQFKVSEFSGYNLYFEH